MDSNQLPHSTLQKLLIQMVTHKLPLFVIYSSVDRLRFIKFFGFAQ